MRINLIASLLIVAPIVTLANPATASQFTFDSAVDGNSNVGIHKQIKTTFDDKSDVLTWSSTFSKNPNNGKLANGAWLVLSEGPNPKSHVQAYTMFYMDGLNKKLTGYTYNGVNGSDSWKDNNSVFLGSWDLGVTESENERTFDFGLDMGEINSRIDLGSAWKGTAFADTVGVWFHGVSDLQTSYNIDGSLSNFSYASQGWFDSDALATTKVPEPGAIAGLALAGLLGAKTLRRKSA